MDNQLTNLSNADEYSPQELAAIQHLAKLRAEAEADGVSFTGGFVTLNNRFYITSTSDCPQEEIDSMAQKILGSNN